LKTHIEILKRLIGEFNTDKPILISCHQSFTTITFRTHTLPIKMKLRSFMEEK